jgi:putative nucleotidyltransferase with HDIG domain
VAITSNRNLGETLRVLLEQITSRLEVDAALVLLLDSGNTHLEYAAGRGFRTQALQFTRLPLGQGNAGLAAQRRTVIGIPDLQGNAQAFVHAPLLAQEGFVSYYAAPLVASEKLQGVLEIFHRWPLDPDAEWLAFLEALAGQAAIAIDNTSLFADLQQAHHELSAAYDATIEGWSHALDLRDRETEGHTRRVTEMTAALARAAGMAEADLVHIRRGALLHDIGKMGIPDSILNKAGPLTEEEWQVMRQHPTYAYEMLWPIAYLRPALDIPWCHHEKWDGTGYPRQLVGAAIPLAARLFAVVDVWDALRSDRPYRRGWPEARVREYIRTEAGSHFDPAAVGLFLRMLGE